MEATVNNDTNYGHTWKSKGCKIWLISSRGAIWSQPNDLLQHHECSSQTIGATFRAILTHYMAWHGNGANVVLVRPSGKAHTIIEARDVIPGYLYTGSKQSRKLAES